ncbi:NAD(P)-dependent oxidoreductase [Streptomyces litchfieldiae]|uniref:NAD(P)-dependent oxidoreductase n=1 Tax=Streptomyces litchfieldiae TaxID=3075543 RepID=A0ABU2MRZ7_9ACTN|nr:NAD(P)-dependent oxidoreductase [Streptomyces sp. DSM 44938]MDT0343673.1 NAD(P)-dependent oxidoreductase [Streptomyces sp. DSM 44938]
MAEPIPVLVAGDHFVRNRLLIDALHAEGGPAAWQVRELELPWPRVPFGRVAEVDEASGSEERMIEALGPARVCLTQMAPLTRRVLAACPELELFAVSRGGPVNANLAAAAERGVAVTFAPGRNAESTAEHTLGLMLAAMRRIPRAHAGMLAGRWDSELFAYDATGLEIAGSTVGLVGAGAVGRRVAAALVALGADVLVSDPYADPAAMPAGARLVPLEELLERSTVVSLHARLTDETAELIGAAELAAMPRGSVLVNCARGGLLDYAALAAALRNGHLFAAGLDVYDVEPLPADHPLRTAPNVVLTPHLAGASRAVAERAARMVAAEAGRWLRGEPPLHHANPAGVAR